MKAFHLVILLATSLFAACTDTRDGDLIDTSLMGTWSRIDVIPSGTSNENTRTFDMRSSYRFSQDATYAYTVSTYGFEDENPNEVVASFESNGVYEVKADSLLLIAVGQTVWDREGNVAMDTVYADPGSFRTKFEIVARDLTLSYLSFPADAPVQTEMIYTKVD